MFVVCIHGRCLQACGAPNLEDNLKKLCVLVSILQFPLEQLKPKEYGRGELTQLLLRAACPIPLYSQAVPVSSQLHI